MTIETPSTDAPVPVDTPAPTQESVAPPSSEPAKAPEAPAIDPKMVVPASADDYKLPIPEGDKGEFAKVAAKWFHEAGVPPGQAEKLASKWNEFTALQKEVAAQAEADANKQADAKFKEEDASLRKEWGGKYDANLELGKRAYREFGFTDDVVNAIEDKVGSAQLLKIFANIGRRIGEDTAVGVGQSNGLTNESAAQKLYG